LFSWGNCIVLDKGSARGLKKQRIRVYFFMKTHFSKRNWRSSQWPGGVVIEDFRNAMNDEQAC